MKGFCGAGAGWGAVSLSRVRRTMSMSSAGDGFPGVPFAPVCIRRDERICWISQVCSTWCLYSRAVGRSDATLCSNGYVLRMFVHPVK